MALGAGGNQDLLFYLGMRALKSADPGLTYWSLQRHHPDGRRWIEVGRFPSKPIAQMALEAFVAHGQGEADDFRVKRVTLPPG